MSEEMKQIYYGKLSNQKWPIYVAATDKGICFVGSLNGGKTELNEWLKKIDSIGLAKYNPDKLAYCVNQLEEYFKGERTYFHLPLDIKGTPFQEKVWAELLNIPYGGAITYGELAKRIGNPRASRAVGTAIGKNPLLIIIPCHRVSHKNGQVSGYRGPINMKVDLLALEKQKRKSVMVK